METEEPEVSLSNALRRLIQKRFSERVKNPESTSGPEKSLNNLGKRIRSLELKEKELKVQHDTEERPDLPESPEPNIEPEQNEDEHILPRVRQAGKQRDRSVRLLIYLMKIRYFTLIVNLLCL